MAKTVVSSSSAMPPALDAAIKARGVVPPSADKLDRVRDKVRELRQLYLQKEALTSASTEIQASITKLETQELVDLFNETGIPAMSLVAEGNFPAVDVEKQPFYSAKIPEGRELEAYRWFEAEGHGDLIKTAVSLSFGMGERKLAKRLEDWLEKQKLPFESKVSIHSGTLVSFVKKETQAARKIPLDLLGAHVGEICKLKPRKEKK